MTKTLNLNINTNNLIKQTKRINYPKTRFITIKKNGNLYSMCNMINKKPIQFQSCPIRRIRQNFPGIPWKLSENCYRIGWTKDTALRHPYKVLPAP